MQKNTIVIVENLSPCFDDFYKNTTEFIVSNIDMPKHILDLGAGTGLLTYFWYQQSPDADKVNLFSKIYDGLPGGGLFINYDQFCA